MAAQPSAEQESGSLCQRAGKVIDLKTQLVLLVAVTQLNLATRTHGHNGTGTYIHRLLKAVSA